MRGIFGSALALAFTFGSNLASAYECTPVRDVRPALTQAWTSRCIPYFLNDTGALLATSDRPALIAQSWRVWTDQNCTDLELRDRGTTLETPGFDPDSSRNRNVIYSAQDASELDEYFSDRDQLAVTLTRDGGSQIYLISAEGGDSRRMTQSSGIDTEPAFAPDGSSIFFTSDRGGSPQIYRMTIADGSVSRVTFGSTYNVSPRVSPDGKQLAFITRREGRFMVGLKDLASGNETLLTDSGQEESPSFAPNGLWVMYSTRAGGGEYLMAVTTDGRIKQRLTSSAGDIREPAWGPYPK